MVANAPDGLKPSVIKILPEGKVPHSWGQRCLTIHPTNLLGLTPKLLVRKRSITFAITLTQRVRDIPNDDFEGIAYLDETSMACVLEALIPTIESDALFAELKTAVDSIVIPSTVIPMYQWENSFRFLSMNLDPRHLYPSDFGTRSGNDKEQLYDKIAGYSMTAVFESPVYFTTNSTLQCR